MPPIFLFHSKPKLLVKHELLLPCLQVAFAMCIEGNDDDDEEEEEEGVYLSMHTFGCQMIDHFARIWHSEKLWAPCIAGIEKLANSPKPLDRRAALDVLTVSSISLLRLC